MRRWLGVLALGIALAALSPALSGPHPYHDDGGLINWRSSLSGALQESNRLHRPVLLEVCKDADANAKKLAENFKDPTLAKMVSRYCIPVVLDSKAANADATVKGLLGKAGKAEPYLLILNEKGAYLNGMSGYKKTNEVEGAILNVLKENYKMSEATEKKLEEQVDMLNKLVEGKDWAKAVPLFKSIIATRGYSGKKEVAYDLMDTAQAEIDGKYKDAVAHVRKREFADAKSVLGEVLKNKEYAPMPLFGEAKEYLAAVKLLEEADKYINDSKAANAKSFAVQKLDTLLKAYGDTPFAAIANTQKRELTKDPKAK